MKKAPPVFADQPYLVYGGDYNPDQWRRWPEILEEDVRLMKGAGINSATVGIFAWQALEPEEGKYDFGWLDETLDRLWKNGISVILATPSGARPAWMDRAHPEVMRVTEDRRKNLHGFRHNHCYTSPYYRKKVQEMNTLLAERYGHHPAVKMWHISNEYGGECHCERCQEAFRDWLRKKYHNNIEELNVAWWSAFWSHTYNSFDQIESPSSLGEYHLHGLKLDWRRFVSDQHIAFYRNEVEPLKKIAPEIPVTTNLMGTYLLIDPRKLAPYLDRAAWDSYPDWHCDDKPFWEVAVETAFVHDLNRALLPDRPFMLMESTPSNVNHKPYNKLKRPGVNTLAEMQAVAHGSDTVQYFQFRKSRGSSEKFHGAVVDHVGSENTRVYREVAELGELLGKLPGVSGTVTRPEVGLIYDWENRWALDDVQGLQQNNKEYEEICKEHYQPFWKSGVSVDVLSMDADFSKYRLIVAPMLYMLRPGVAERLKAFVKAGGTLVTTYVTGYVDENDLCFLGGFPGDGMIELTGIWAEEMDTLYPTDRNGLCLKKDGSEYTVRGYAELVHPQEGCEVLATYTDDFYAGMPALTRHPYGDGVCYHMAARTERDFLERFYRELIDEIGLEKALGGDLPEGVTVQQRSGDGETYYFALNFNAEAKSFPIEGSYVDAVSGEKRSGVLELPPYGVAVLCPAK